MNIFHIPSIFYYCQQVLFTLRVSSLLSPLNDVSVDMELTMRAFFSFLQQLSSHHPYKFTSPLQRALKQNHVKKCECEKHVETLSIQKALKRVVA